MKQLLVKLAMMASLCASSAVVHAQCAGFTDVAANSFCPNVEWVKNRSITAGCTSSTYCPGEPVSRLTMAAFLSRMGKALTPDVLFVDQNPGAVTIQNGGYQFVCLSAPYPVTGFPRRAVARGLAWGIVDNPVSWWADLWYSTDGGATFSYMANYIPAQSATIGGQLTQGTTFARMDLAVGSTYVFAILIRESQDLPGGVGNFTDLACHLMVEIGNRNEAPAPPPPPPPPCDATEAAATAGGKLGGNAGALKPASTCG